MNAVVTKLCQMTRTELVRAPLISTLTDLNSVADRYLEIGPIPSALLLTKILDDVQYLQPVHLKLINRLSTVVDVASSELPPPLAIKLFNSLHHYRHPLSRRILASVQSKWFDYWRPASVERGSRRPKLKQNFVGSYADEAVLIAKLGHAGVVTTLDDATLTAAVAHVTQIAETATSGFRDIALISKALVLEYRERFGKSDENIERFIQSLGLESQ